ncbi:MAG: PAS domain S-box protein [Dehalococcoidia bacterium]|nr:PAS domain S-box protein [Dehalococcoidia bacterium]
MPEMTHTHLVDQAPDAVIFAGADGRITTWNTAAERMFGFTAAEAIGQSLDIIIPERFRDAHWKGFERAMGDGVTKYAGQFLPTRAQKEDGSQFYVELGFAIIVVDGESVGAMATARDITERFESDRAQRRKLKETEEELAKLRG